MTQHTALPASRLPAPAASHATALAPISYRPDVDGLRAVAVLSVLLFHAFPDALPGGFIGVDIFFVISGFLISSIIAQALARSAFSLHQFYVRRILRIFPALVTVLLATYAVGWWLLPADAYAQLGAQIVAGAGFFSNFAYWKQAGYFDTAAHSKPLLHLWSLAIEEQFYLIWPLVLLAAARLRGMRGLLLAAVALGIMSFLQNLYGVHTRAGDAGLYYSPLLRFWELLVGAALALWRVQRSTAERSAARKQLADHQSVLGAAAIVAGLVCINSDSAFPGWWALLPTAGAALLIGAGPQAWLNRVLLSHPVAVWLGLITYPLYLWHWPLLSFAHQIAGDTPSATVRLGAVLLAVPLAWATKRLVEDPIRHTSQPAPSRTVLLIVAMAGVAALGGWTQYQNGLSWRYGKIELQGEVGRLECDDRKKNSGCVFGNPQGKLVVVYGDSHAEHLTRALDEALGKQYLFQMVTNGSCFMGEQVLRPDIGNLRDCQAAREQLHALRGREVYAVIRSQRWHAYGGDTASGIRTLVDDALLAGGLHPQRTVIVGSTADVNYDCEVSNYYAMPLSQQQQCRPAEDNRHASQLFISTTQAMQAGPDVRFVYPYTALCPGDDCHAIADGVANYTDTHHMSREAALRVMPEIERSLR